MQQNPFGTLHLQPMQLERSANKRGSMSAEYEQRIRRNVKPASVVNSKAAFPPFEYMINTPIAINQVNNWSAVPTSGLFGKHSYS